jgi:hypothetical protein
MPAYHVHEKRFFLSHKINIWMIWFDESYNVLTKRKSSVPNEKKRIFAMTNLYFALVNLSYWTFYWKRSSTDCWMQQVCHDENCVNFLMVMQTLISTFQLFFLQTLQKTLTIESNLKLENNEILQSTFVRKRSKHFKKLLVCFQFDKLSWHVIVI